MPFRVVQASSTGSIEDLASEDFGRGGRRGRRTPNPANSGGIIIGEKLSEEQSKTKANESLQNLAPLAAINPGYTKETRRTAYVVQFVATLRVDDEEQL